MKRGRLLFLSLMLLGAACGTRHSEEVPETRATEPEPAAAPLPVDDRPMILAFGDSLSAGYGAEAGQSYPDYLQKQLDAAGYRYRVVNHGISGDTTSGGLARVQQAVALKPYLAIVELGGNDGLRGLPLRVTRDNLDRIVSAFLDSGANVVVTGMTLPLNYGRDYIREFEDLYRYLEKKHGVRRMGFLLEGVAMKPDLMQRDQIHPTAAGNKIVARNVFAVIEPLLKR